LSTPKTVVQGDLKAGILPRTVRSEMHRKAILRQMTWFIDVAEAEDVAAEEVDIALSKFARLGANIDHDASSLDFDLPKATDSSDEVRRKFEAFLEYENVTFYDAIEVALNEAYAPPASTKKKPASAATPNAS